MRALGPEIWVERLEFQHLESLAPHLLGEAVWEVVAPLRPQGWADMKALVEQRYGLSDSRIRDCFYAMRPEASEFREGGIFCTKSRGREVEVR